MALNTDDYEKQLRETLRILLNECNESQQKFFLKLYPNGIDGISYHRLSQAIMQCQRTLQKTKEKISKTNDLTFESIQESQQKVKEADIIISITKIEESSTEQIKLPIKKLKHQFKCCECGEDNPELQYMTTEYCFLCITK